MYLPRQRAARESAIGAGGCADTRKPTGRPYGAILAAGFEGERGAQPRMVHPRGCVELAKPFNEAGAARGKHPANPAGTLICEGTPQNERFAGCKNHLFKSMVRYCHLVLHFSLFP